MNYRESLDSILPLVEKPARYVGGEWNAVHKTADETAVRIALCFPDTYEIGMSHLGLKILYGVLNNREGWAAERVSEDSDWERSPWAAEWGPAE